MFDVRVNRIYMQISQTKNASRALIIGINRDSRATSTVDLRITRFFFFSWIFYDYRVQKYLYLITRHTRDVFPYP